jgi:hypothetical protein
MFSTLVDSSIIGPGTVYTDQVVTYTIGNYNQSTTYTITAQGGTFTRSGDTITYTVTTTPTGTASITVNGITRTLSVLQSTVNTPSITSPANGDTNISVSPVFTGSTFAYTGAPQTQNIVRWELATNSNFSNVVQFYEGSSNLTSWTPPTSLSVSSNYYLRVKYQSALGGWSAWSTSVSFSTMADSSISGPMTVYTNQVATYTINSYSGSSTYNISVVGGSYTRSGATITFTVTASASGAASITVNGVVTTLTVLASTVNTPNITSPTNNATDISLTPSFTSSAFAYTGTTQTQDSVRWELATDASFNSTVQFYEGTSNLTGWSPTALTMNLTYHVRVKYHSAIGGWSAWSTSVSFSTIADSSITGPSTVYTGQVVTYTINNYSGSVTYNVSVVGGTFTRSGADISFTITTTTGPVSITVNGTTRTLILGTSTITTPSITSHSNNATDVSITPTFTSSPFAFTGSAQTQDSVEWQLATDSGFTVGLQSYSGTSNLISWTPSTNLTGNTVYYIRVRHHSSVVGWSSYSPTITFTTVVTLTITGPSTVYTNTPVDFTIDNYSGSTTYTITSIGGTTTRANGIITFIPGATAQNGSITVNGIAKTFTIVDSGITTPNITAPTDNATNVLIAPTFNSSSFIGVAQTQDNVRWEVSPNSDFSSISREYEGSSNFTIWVVTSDLLPTQSYYVRVKYRSNLGRWSAWSQSIKFTTGALAIITGPTTGYNHQQLTLTITNYDPLANYTLVCVGGTATQSGATITFTVSDTYIGAASVKVNTTLFNINILQTLPNPPSISTPTNNATEVSLLPTFNSSGFVSNNNVDTHYMTQWIVYRVSDNAIISDHLSSTDLTSYTLTTGLSLNTVYGVKCRYIGHYGVYSDWSNWSSSTQFTTTAGPGWVARLDGRLTYEAFQDSTVDSSGNTYTVGRDVKTNSGGYVAESALIAKWDTSGSLVWMYRLASTTEHSIFMGITCDASNNIYAVGEVNIGSGLVAEGLITKWDTNGTLIWQKTVSALGGERYNSVTCDTSGNVYAVWFIDQNDPVKVRLENWRYMASNPYRTDKDDEWLKTELEALKLIGIEPKYQPVARRKFQRNKS